MTDFKQKNIKINWVDGLRADTFNGPCCPYCSYEDENHRGLNLRNGETTVYECGECQEEFEVTLTITTMYTNRVIL